MTPVGSSRGKNWSVRYYFCSGDLIALRIPNTLHQELLANTLMLPEFANTRQKVLEVFVGQRQDGPVLLEAKGSIYSFNSDGLVDPHPAVEALTSIIEGSKPRRVQDHVIDIGPVVRNRRWIKEQTWRPTASMLNAVRKDLRASVATGLKRIPALKPSSKRFGQD